MQRLGIGHPCPSGKRCRRRSQRRASLPLPLPLDLLTQLPHVIQSPARLLSYPRRGSRAVRIKPLDTRRRLLRQLRRRILLQLPHLLGIHIPTELTRTDAPSQHLSSRRVLPSVSPQALNKRLNFRLSTNRNPTPIAVRRE